MAPDKFTVRVKVKVSLSGSTDVKEDQRDGTHQSHPVPALHGVPLGRDHKQGRYNREDENTVRLTHAEWNELVDLIKRGKLREV